jgi:hypothetical protein
MSRIRFWTAMMMGVCVLVIATGCSKHAKVASAETKAVAEAVQKPAGKSVNLSLKFNAGDTNTYRVVMEAIKDYKFEQPSINQTKEQQTLSRTEVVYDQATQSIDPSGNAKSLIAIKEVKYLAKSPKGTTVDFDSTREADKKNALENLIGQSYIVTITPAGEVIAVADVQKAIDAVKGDSMEQKVAQSLLADDAIKQRHMLIALPEKKDSSAMVGKSWSKIKGSPAGMLTPKSYEKVYTLSEVTDEQVAVVNMDARPTAEKAADMPKDEAKGMGLFGKMFDNKETYTGKLLLDTRTGKVNGYSEKLKSEWVAIEPAEEQKSDKGPDVLTMGFTYMYNIEKIK